MDELETLQLQETKMLARIKPYKSVCENMLKEPGFLRLRKGSLGGFTPCIEGHSGHDADHCLALLRTEQTEALLPCGRGECVIM